MKRPIERSYALAVLIGQLLLGVSPNLRAAEVTAASPRDASLKHFENGIKLFEDHNYVGALAEFEAAYRAYPSASSLQNVALCQKQLYRYSEAKDTLQRLLELHAVQLSSVEKKTVEDAVTELEALVGSVRITVVPPQAHLILDGRTLSASELERAISLDVGEHRITAEAEGHAPLSRSFRVAGGQRDAALALNLVETTGTLEISAPDAQTAIAIDGRPVAFESFVGRLPPGRHIVQVYKDGFEPYEEEIELELGDHLRVIGELGEPTGASPPGSVGTSSKRPPLGFYGLGTASLLAVRGHPVGFRASSDYDFGYELGMRAGYRFSTPLGVELSVGSGSFTVQGHCQDELATSCPSATARSYHLDTRRLGAGVRWMSRDETLRFAAAASAGAVAKDLSALGEQATGYDGYAAFELGLSVNYRHTLWELLGLGIFEGASGVRQGAFRPYEDGAGVQFFGLGLRGGWSEWQPTRKVPPMPKAPPKTPSASTLQTPPAVTAKTPSSRDVTAPAPTQAPKASP